MVLSIGCCVLSSVGSGCVLRKETITVARDTSVVVELKYEGPKEEIASGDAMPSEASGWSVERSEKKEDNEVKQVLTSRRRFAPGEALPRTYAAAGDPETDLYLDFPTQVWTQQRADGVYYYFRRVYTPRRWGYVRYWYDAMFEDGDLKRLKDKPVEELTMKERAKLAKALASVEAMKQIEFGKAAFTESLADRPPEVWLRARQALLDVYKQDDYFEGVVDRCEPLAEADRAACFETEAKKLLARGFDEMIGTLEQQGLSEAQIERFRRAYEHEKRYYQITESLGGHLFSITVRMPGTIIAHNALDEEVEEEGNGVSSIEFEFDGKAFRDRPMEILVVSRVGPTDDKGGNANRERGSR
ncbi:MAG: hypothetical protein D6788_08960 [Planctomycetota bacterium]|nr:MAG: hypothetical protein D6788_08960 [Planctomycetota bacterium]